MTFKHVLVLFLVIISNICHADDMKPDFERIKEGMKLANERIEETKRRLNTPLFPVPGSLGASTGISLMFYPASGEHTEAGGELNAAITFITKALRHIIFFAESYPECEQTVTLLNLYNSVHNQLEHISVESDVLFSLSLTSEVKSQLLKVEDIAKKINFELSKI